MNKATIFLLLIISVGGMAVAIAGTNIINLRGGIDDIVLENGNLPVAIQDQHSHIVGTLMSQAVGIPQTLANDTIVGSYDINMTTGHSFITGDELFIVQTDRSFHALVKGVVGDTITINSPVDQIYSTTDAIVFEVISNMVVDGSTTVQEFSVEVGSNANISLDVTGIRFIITDNLDMDDGKFGGIAALSKGIVFQIIHKDGTHNLWTARTNGKMGLVVNHQEYTTKAPAGQYGVNYVWQIANDNGVTLRLDAGDKIKILIQDDLTDLSSFKAWVYGHEVLN